MAGKVCSKRKRFETPCVTAWSWLPSPVASRGRGRAPVLALVVLADWLKRAEPGPLTRPAGSDNDLHLPLNSGPRWHRADVRRYAEALRGYLAVTGRYWLEGKGRAERALAVSGRAAPHGNDRNCLFDCLAVAGGSGFLLPRCRLNARVYTW